MISKLSYVGLFLALTLVHICAHLKPTIEANASIKTINLQLTRKLNLYVGYEYHHTMLWQAVMNTALLLFGFWRCQREVDNAKIRYRLPDPNNNVRISAAAEVKLDWFRRRGKLPTSWQLFPMRHFAWFGAPWTLTLLFHEFCNYAQLNLVMRHFCTSLPEVLLLYVRLQMLYLQSLLTNIIGSYLLQFHGAVVTLTSSHANYINYESNLFVGDE